MKKAFYKLSAVLTFIFSAGFANAGLIDAIDIDGTLQTDPSSSTFTNFVETSTNITSYDDGGFSGTYIRTNASGLSSMTFQYTNLAAHDSIDLGLLVARIGSVDPNRDGDLFSIFIDDVEVFQAGFGFGNAYGFSEAFMSNFELNGVAANNTLLANTLTATNNDGWGYNIYNVGALEALSNIAHTSDTLKVTINARTNQGYSNEAYGFDNVSIKINEVPEPSTLAIFALGIIGLASRQIKKHS